MPAAPAPASHETVLQQFRVVFNAVKTHLQQMERQTGVSGAQRWALSVVRGHPGIGVSGLAAALHVRQPTASILVRNLAQQGLVEVGRNGPDRRSVQLAITEQGRTLLGQTPQPGAGVLPAALQQLDPAALDLLSGGLSQLIQQLGGDGRVGTQTAEAPKLAKAIGTPKTPKPPKPPKTPKTPKAPESPKTATATKLRALRQTPSN